MMEFESIFSGTCVYCNPGLVTNVLLQCLRYGSFVTCITDLPIRYNYDLVCFYVDFVVECD